MVRCGLAALLLNVGQHLHDGAMRSRCCCRRFWHGICPTFHWRSEEGDFPRRCSAEVETKTLYCVCNGPVRSWSSRACFAHQTSAVWRFQVEGVSFQHRSMLRRGRTDLLEARSSFIQLLASHSRHRSPLPGMWSFQLTQGEPARSFSMPLSGSS